MKQKRSKIAVIVDREYLGPLGLEEAMIPVIYEDIRQRITESAHSTEGQYEDKLYAEHDQPQETQGGIHDG